MKYYTQDNLINSLNISSGSEVVFLLGAGCSIASGCMSAKKLIHEFRKRIYCIQNNICYNESLLFDDAKFESIADDELPQGVNPYSYYFEKCFPLVSDRNNFIKSKFENIKPSYGFLCFANYLISHKIRYVITTNFDKLCEKAIQKLDDGYDLSVSSDELSPIVTSKLNLVKLHGDYIYDNLKNTEEELASLSKKISLEIQAINTKKIVVIGYSGQDYSVMSCLEEYIRSHLDTEIIWCTVDSNRPNTLVERLMSINDKSAYCQINGFDELFIRTYKCYGPQNDIINQIDKSIKFDEFALSEYNQPKNFLANCYPIKNNPLFYRIKHTIESKQLKEINDNSLGSFIIQHKNYLYAVGDLNCITKSLNVNEEQCDKVELSVQTIPVIKKCKLIKELIKISAQAKGLKIYNDNIYLVTCETEIKEGIRIKVELFQNKICLILNINYFCVSQFITDSMKFKMNNIKSKIYANANLQKLQTLISQCFDNSLTFAYGGTQVIFYNKPYGFHTNSIVLSNYNCASEPIMVGDKYKSVNPIKIITESGPRKTLFSVDTIRIGVFCVEEDKMLLKGFLDQLVTGSKKVGTNLIPQYKGFNSVFGKNIEILYDALPPFYINNKKISNFDFIDFAEFCLRGIDKMYKEKQIDIALIYIGNNYKKFRVDGEKDLHDYIKLHCLNKFKTQFLEEKTLKSSDNINKKLLNLATALYTKTIGMSWCPENYSKDTLFLGISFGGRF